MSDINQAFIRTAIPVLCAFIVSALVAFAATFAPLNVIILAGMAGVLLYIIANMFLMNLDQVREERDFDEAEALEQ